MQEQAREAVSHFELEGVTGEPRPFGSGHINDTFLVEGEKRCVLQRMNRTIFSSPGEVMENIVGVTEFLKKNIA